MKPKKIKNKWKCSYRKKDGWEYITDSYIYNKKKYKPVFNYNGMPF